LNVQTESKNKRRQRQKEKKIMSKTTNAIISAQEAGQYCDEPMLSDQPDPRFSDYDVSPQGEKTNGKSTKDTTGA
jgi:hypothetical protein